MRTITLVLTCALALSITPTSLSLSSLTSSDGLTDDTGGTLGKYHDQLKIGLKTAGDGRSCSSLTSCTDLEGSSLNDIDVSDAMAKIPSNANWVRYQFTDADKYTAKLVEWRVCQYRSDGALLQCNTGDGSGSGILANVNRDTETMRVVLVSGVERGYNLHLYWA